MQLLCSMENLAALQGQRHRRTLQSSFFKSPATAQVYQKPSFRSSTTVPTMAAIVPISCNQRWRSRSRSRNASTDSDFLGLMPTSPSVAGEISIDMLHEATSEDDDENKGVERVESPHNLVMPREYAAQEAAWPVQPMNNAKSMERRRASGF